MSEPVQYHDIEGFPGYRVGDEGSVWSCKVRGKRGIGKIGAWRKLKQISHPAGYLTVSLCVGLKAHTNLVHQIVLTAFVGPRPIGAQGCHNDGNPANNAIGNLRWDTPAANSADRIRHGTQFHAKGELCGTARLTADTVREIRNRASAGEPQRALAKEFGIKQPTVSMIVNGKRWAHVEGVLGE